MTEEMVFKAMTPAERQAMEQREQNGEFDDPMVCVGCGA